MVRQTVKNRRSGRNFNQRITNLLRICELNAMPNIRMETVLSVKNLFFDYEAAETLSDVSFDIQRGDFAALSGPNGAGKTTLLKIILGLEKIERGTVKVFDGDIGRFSDWSKIGYLPQRVNVFNPLFPATAKETVKMGLLSLKKFPKKFNRTDENKVREIFELLGIVDLENRSIGELSGGQQQRVFLARALVVQPELLILDEPGVALDPEIRERFFRLTEKLNKEKNTTIIMSTHDTSQIGQYANKLLYLDKEIIFFGPFADFCRSAAMEKYFGHFSQHLICHQHSEKS